MCGRRLADGRHQVVRGAGDMGGDAEPEGGESKPVSTTSAGRWQTTWVPLIMVVHGPAPVGSVHSMSWPWFQPMSPMRPGNAAKWSADQFGPAGSGQQKEAPTGTSNRHTP